MEAFFSTNTPILGRWLEPSPPSFHWPLICFGVAFWDGEQERFTIVFATYVFVVASHLLHRGSHQGSSGPQPAWPVRMGQAPILHQLVGCKAPGLQLQLHGWGGGISQGGWWPVGTPPPLENFTLLGLLSSSLIMVIINAINHEPICIAKY